MNWRLSFAVVLVLLLSAKFHAGLSDPNREFQLQANSAEFWSVFDRGSKLSTVASGFGFTEGPVWDPAGFVYVSDEVTNKIFRVYLDGKKEELVALGDPDGNTFDRQQRLIDCASVLRAIIRIDREGRYQILADRFENKRFNSPNDVVVGPDGAIYFTDPTLDLPEGQKQEIPFQGVYRLDASGRVTLLTKELSQPNGLAFSPDGKRLYVDDSERRNIRVFDFTAEHSLENGRILGEEPGGKGEGVPDGMKLDQAGNVYVTGPNGIWVWNPEGHHLGTVILPEQPANLAWGDADYGTLYITATTSVYRLRTKARGFIPYLRRALESKPSAEIYFELGLIALKPDFEKAHYNLGLALRAQGQANAGKKELDQLNALHDFRAHLAQSKLPILHGVEALKNQKLDDALPLFQKAADQSPELPTSYYYLGITYERKDDPARAIAAYQKALELKPDYSQVHSSLGLLYWRQDDRTRALEELHQAVMSDPDLPEGHYNFGLTLVQSGRGHEAARELNEDVSLDPKYTDARVQLGLVLGRNNDTAGAASVFRELVRRDPNFAEAHNILGLVLLQAGDLSAADSEFREALRLKPLYAEAHYNLALALHQQGKEAESRTEFNKASEISPEPRNAPRP